MRTPAGRDFTEGVCVGKALHAKTNNTVRMMQTYSNDVRIITQKITETAPKLNVNVATDLQFVMLIRSSSDHVVKRHPSRDCRIVFAVPCCWRAIHAVAPSPNVDERWLGSSLCQNKQTRSQFHRCISWAVHSKTLYCISPPHSSPIHILRTRRRHPYLLPCSFAPQHSSAHPKLVVS